MGASLTQPEIQWLTGEPLVLLLRDWGAWLPGDRRIVVDAGFRFDGASVPRWAWTLAGHPLAQDTLPSSLAHDALYYAQLVPRAEADAIFRRHLDADGVGYRKRKIYWAAVRVGGRRAWRARTDEELAEARTQIRIYGPDGELAA